MKLRSEEQTQVRSPYLLSLSHHPHFIAEDRKQEEGGQPAANRDLEAEGDELQHHHRGPHQQDRREAEEVQRRVGLGVAQHHVQLHQSHQHQHQQLRRRLHLPGDRGDDGGLSVVVWKLQHQISCSVFRDFINVNFL